MPTVPGSGCQLLGLNDSNIVERSKLSKRLGIWIWINMALKIRMVSFLILYKYF